MSRTRIGVLTRGDPGAQPPLTPSTSRFSTVFAELAAAGVDSELLLYSDERADVICQQMLALDGVLVWVNPLQDGKDRSILDPTLRDVASSGVWVSAHPDVILKMGTKDVLYSTRHMPWGADTRLYTTPSELQAGFPEALRAGVRVLKQHRGNDGNGVWRVELDPTTPGVDLVRVQEAVRGAREETIPLRDFIERCARYFQGSGCLIDQAYQPRLGEGMTRVYLTHDRVVGFGHQFITALTTPTAGQPVPDPPPRLYYGPTQSQFQPLARLLEGGWLAQMQALLGLAREDLPVIWDADFLLGPKTPDGADTYVLCEINVSSVFPIPPESVQPLVQAAVLAVSQGKTLRTG